MSAIKDGGPAFPSPQLLDASGMPRYGEGEFGMTLRDYFAAKAMHGELASQNEDEFYADSDEDARALAEWSYFMADAMIAAREAQP